MSDIKIYGKLVNATTDNKLVGSDQTYDETQGKFQSEINKNIADKLGDGTTGLTKELADVKSDLESHKSNTDNPHAVTKAQVGLSEVDNTSDINKPVSKATKTELDNKLDKTLKGSNNGLAELDENGNVPLSQLGNITKISEIPLEELDSLCTMDNVESPGPVMYSVTKDGLNIGVLLLFSGSRDYSITQVFITHCVWEYGELVVESNNHIYQYYRSYESNASSGGSWNEWQPFIDGNMISVLASITRDIKQNKEAIDAIRPMENEVIDGIWRETNVL